MEASFNISVVIPTYNRAAVIGRAIDSVLAQTRMPDEIIVVDDGSDDDTRDTISEKYDGLVKYVYQSNRGVSHARNVGIKLAKGNWIALLDSDDEWYPEKLEMQLLALSSEPSYDFCHTNEVWIRHGKRVNAMSKHEKSGGFIFEKCLPLCVISPSSVFIKKTVFDETGLFDEELPACEDYDYWLRYCSVKPVLYIESPLLVKYGGHEDQLSKKFLAMDRFRLLALLKTISMGDLPKNLEIAALTVFHEKLNILMSGARKHQNAELLTFCRKIKKQINDLLVRRKTLETVSRYES